MNRLHAKALQRAHRPVLRCGGALTLGGQQPRLKRNTGRHLLRRQLAVECDRGQSRVQRRRVDAGKGGLSLPRGCVGAGGRVRGELPGSFNAAPGHAGLQRLDAPLPRDVVDPRVQALQRQALLVPGSDKCVAEFNARLPARALRRDGGRATQAGLGGLRPQRRQVQRLPAGLRLGHRLRLPGLKAGVDAGLHGGLAAGCGFEFGRELGLQRQGGVTPGQCAGHGCAGIDLHCFSTGRQGG